MFDWMFLLAGSIIALVAVLIVVQMVFHTVLFGSVFHAIVKQIHRQAAAATPRRCVHCGTEQTGPLTACRSCGAPIDSDSPSSVS
jgi:hypothetical protein